MNITNHTPVEGQDPLYEAAVAGATALVEALRRLGLPDGIFLIALARAGQPLSTARLASNLEPSLADEFLHILATVRDAAHKPNERTVQ